MKVTSNEIQRYLTRFVSGNSDIVIPNYFFGQNECDLFRVTPAGLVYEYEIKVSRSDFFNDFKKLNSKKHLNYSLGTGLDCPNRFLFVVPENLISIEECPKYCGLIYYKGGRQFDLKQSGKLLHKTRFSGYQSLCCNLSTRAQNLNAKVNYIRNMDYENEIQILNRQLEASRKENSRLFGELLTNKRNNS